jgi:hypothetical protein
MVEEKEGENRRSPLDYISKVTMFLQSTLILNSGLMDIH